MVIVTNQRNIKMLKQVWDGLDFVMEMFEVPRFPRVVLTGAAHKPYIVNSRDEAMMYFEAALYEDCYMNAYLSYEAMIKIDGLTPTYKPVPNHIMIDLDREPFDSDQELEQALADTLNNIKHYITGISGAYPIVIASGSGGYHIHVPLPGLRTPLQEMPEFEAFRGEDQDLNNKFLRYAERRLTNNRADHRHNPSINSCLFRIPGTINTKAKAAGAKNPVVRVVEGFKYVNNKIAQEYGLPEFALERVESRPTTKFLNDFYAYLVQQQINDKIAKSDRQLSRSLENGSSDSRHPNSIWWIDRLLRSGIEDGRKDLIFWVLAPYLITIKKLDHDKAYSILEQWLEKCDDMRRLEPGWSSFRYRIRHCLHIAEHKERKPIKLETFKEYFPELYGRLFET
jgi:hypothetical protein